MCWRWRATKRRSRKLLQGQVPSSVAPLRALNLLSRIKEAEAKEELKRRAKQLEMQRKEQLRRAQGGVVPPSPGFMSVGSGGIGGYSPVSRFEPSPVPRQSSPAPSALRPPSFKGSGMKLGAKKSSGAQLLDDLGQETNSSGDGRPSASAPTQSPHSTPRADREV